MSHILDIHITELSTPVPDIPASLLIPGAHDPSRMSYRTGRSMSGQVSTELRRLPGTPEQQLWAGVLLGLYREIANFGPKCRALQDIEEEGVEDLESVASQLGMPKGFVGRLIAAGLAEYQRRKTSRSKPKRSVV